MTAGSRGGWGQVVFEVNTSSLLRWMRTGLLVHLTFITLPLLHTHLNITNSVLIMSISPCTWLLECLLLNVFDKGSSQLVLILWTFWKIVLVLSTGTMKHLNEVSAGQSRSQSCKTVTKIRHMQHTKGTVPSSCLSKYNQLPEKDLRLQLRWSVTSRTFYCIDGP